MKRFLCLILALSIVLSLFFGCSNADSDNDENNIMNSNITQEKKPPYSNGSVYDKLNNSSIVFASGFNEGVCLINFENEKDILYCIDKKGNIGFRLETIDVALDKKFINGLAYLINEKGFVDIYGNLTRPEDVGVSNFYSGALYEGYIIADVITADFSSTKIEVGIMNIDFEWVVEPSVELYKELCDGNNFVMDSFNNYRTAYNGYYYISGIKSFLDLKSGEVYKYEDFTGDFPIECISEFNGHYMITPNQSTLFDFDEYYGKSTMSMGKYINGYAPLSFYNAEVGKSYLTFVDKNGNFKFDPIEVWDNKVYAATLDYDGNYILVKSANSVKNIKCFDINGDLIGSIQFEGTNNHVNLSDGVIAQYNSSGALDYEYTFYNPDFTPLF